jgi:acyl carrier protein phosphodiesterase
MPAKVKKYLPYMVLFDWLGSYVNIESIRMVLDGMAKRTSLPNKSAEAIDILEKNYQNFDNEFNIFFPEIIIYVRNHLNLS